MTMTKSKVGFFQKTIGRLFTIRIGYSQTSGAQLIQIRLLDKYILADFAFRIVKGSAMVMRATLEKEEDVKFNNDLPWQILLKKARMLFFIFPKLCYILVSILYGVNILVFENPFSTEGFVIFLLLGLLVAIEAIGLALWRYKAEYEK